MNKYGNTKNLSCYIGRAGKRDITKKEGLLMTREKKEFTPLEIRQSNGVGKGGISMDRKKKFLTGFTLIELMIVMAVIAILVGIILPNIRGMQEEARISKVKGELRTLQTAIESYYIHNSNAYPSTTTTLCASYLNSATPRIVEDPAYDPFGDSATEEYNYRLSNDANYYAIWSEGPAGNGAVSAVADSTGDVTETNGGSCIFVANGDKDTTP